MGHMRWGFLQIGKKQKEEGKTLLYHQDIFLNTHLKKQAIRKYILFIKKDKEFLVANWSEHLPQSIESLKLTSESFVPDLLREGGQRITAEQVESFYREQILIPKEMNSRLVQERDMWSQLGVTHVYPLCTIKGELFGFFGCTQKNTLLDTVQQQAFIQLLHWWAKQYHDLHLEHERKGMANRQNSLMDYLASVTKMQSSEDAAKEVLLYFLSLMKATRGILFGLRGAYYVPMGYRNVDFLRSYQRKKLDGLQKQKGFEVATASELFETEFGKGVVRLVPIGKKHLLVFKPVFGFVNTDSFTKSVIQITDQLLERLVKV